MMPVLWITTGSIDLPYHTSALAPKAGRLSATLPVRREDY
jgi:hypothetical protein